MKDVNFSNNDFTNNGSIFITSSTDSQSTKNQSRNKQTYQPSEIRQLTTIKEEEQEYDRAEILRSNINKWKNSNLTKKVHQRSMSTNAMLIESYISGGKNASYEKDLRSEFVDDLQDTISLNSTKRMLPNIEFNVNENENEHTYRNLFSKHYHPDLQTYKQIHERELKLQDHNYIKDMNHSLRFHDFTTALFTGICKD
jgi:hypothetical protein